MTITLPAFTEQLKELMETDVPISNTTRGEQIGQTFRNKLSQTIKEAIFEDCMASCTDGDILPYLTKTGIILEIPNRKVADTITNTIGSGAISIELNISIKGLEYNASDEADDYTMHQFNKQKKAEEAAAKKEAKIARDKKMREEREAKRARLVEEVHKSVRYRDED